MKSAEERLQECQKKLEKKFSKFWRKAREKGCSDADIAAAVAAMTESVPVALNGSVK
jgi:hypothetical protein